MKAPYRTSHRLPVGLLLLATATFHSAEAEQPRTPDDGSAQAVSLAAQWADRAFARATLTDAQSATAPLPCSWTVTHKSYQVLADTTVWKTPITLGDEVFPHGIYMDAPAAVRVRLTVPAVAFTAIVGIDNNTDTQRMPDAGSARFHIVAKGERLFSTPVLHLRDKAIRINIPLSGVTEFTLETDDGGNGRGWDQCVWANAAVKLTDQTVVFLDNDTLNDSLPNRSNVPFSFTYGGRPSAELLPQWKYSQTTESLDGSEQRTASYLDPNTGLLIECQVTTYSDSSGIDWVCRLSNTGNQDTPVIEQFLPLHVDSLIPDLSPGLPMTLRWSNGDGCTDQSFLPHDELLEVGQHRQFTARSSDTTCFPFFNLHSPGGGWILAIGWTGTWTAQFGRSSSGEVSSTGGHGEYALFPATGRTSAIAADITVPLSRRRSDRWSQRLSTTHACALRPVA